MGSDVWKTSLIWILVGISATLAVAVAYLWSNSIAIQPSSEVSDSTNDGINDNAKLELISVNAYDYPNRRLIGIVEEGQSYNRHEPVFITANFSNPNDTSGEYLVFSQIRGPEGPRETTTLSISEAEVAGSGYLAVNMYWQPEEVGDYQLLVWSVKPEDLRATPPTFPAASIPLVVVEG